MNDVKELFSDVDFDDGGELEMNEVLPLLEYLAEEFLGGLSSAIVLQMYQVVDASGDGTIQWPEVRACARASFHFDSRTHGRERRHQLDDRER